MAEECVGVRPRRAADGSALAGVLRETHRKDRYPMVWPADAEGWLNPPGLAAAWVASAGVAGGKAGQGGCELLGHVAVVTGVEDPVIAEAVGTAARLASVTRLFVAPTARGRRLSLGARLLETAGGWAEQNGHRLMLDVVDDGGPAIDLYERLGWRLVDGRIADWQTPDGRPVPLRLYLAPESGGARG